MASIDPTKLRIGTHPRTLLTSILDLLRRVHNYGKTTAPGAGDDNDAGFRVGSRWIDETNDKEYVCLDDTDGAAVWVETTQASGTVGQVPLQTEIITSSTAAPVWTLSGGYHSYTLKGWAIPVTDGATLFGRVNNGGGILSGAADYNWAGTQYPIGAAASNQGDPSDSEIQISLATPIGSAAGEGVSFVISILGTTGAALLHSITWRAAGTSNGGFRTIFFGGGFYIGAATTALTEFQLLFSSGNIERMHATLYGDNTV